MRRETRYILFLSLILGSLWNLPIHLNAQIQTLPKIELGSDAFLTMPLIKRQMDYPAASYQESLSSFLPPPFSIKYRQPSWIRAEEDRMHLNLVIDSAARAELDLSFYPVQRPISLFAVGLAHQIPDSTSTRSVFSLGVRHKFLRSLSLTHGLYHRVTATDSLETGLTGYSMSFALPTVSLGAVGLNDLTTNLGYDYWTQVSTMHGSQDRSFSLIQSQKITWGGHVLDSKFLVEDDNVGIDVVYQIPGMRSSQSHVSLGLMTDFRSVLPSISAFQRFNLNRGLWLEVGNKPDLHSNTHKRLSDLNSWAAHQNDGGLTFIPLNLDLALIKTFAPQRPLKYLSVVQNLSFEHDHPTLAFIPATRQTQIAFTDWVRSESIFSAFLNLPNVALKQDLSLNLEFLPTHNWSRRPYSPALKASTTLACKLGPADLDLYLRQDYFQRDDQNRDLPEAIDLGFSLSFPFQDRYKFVLGARNLFDTQHFDHGRTKGSGRSVYVSFRAIP